MSIFLNIHDFVNLLSLKFLPIVQKTILLEETTDGKILQLLNQW